LPAARKARRARDVVVTRLGCSGATDGAVVGAVVAVVVAGAVDGAVAAAVVVVVGTVAAVVVVAGAVDVLGVRAGSSAIEPSSACCLARYSNPRATDSSSCDGNVGDVVLAVVGVDVDAGAPSDDICVARTHAPMTNAIVLAAV
jgi:hypothetical protein